MSVSAAELAAKKCAACEGGVKPFAPDQIAEHLPAVPEWKLSECGKWIRRKYRFADFVTALAFVNRVGELAEADDHHPDVHITGYRHVLLELSTHAIGGLSANDFILAAKIDALT